MADAVENLMTEFRLLNCSPLKPLHPNEPVYVTHANIGQKTNALATGETSGIIRICELDNLIPTGVIYGHKKHLTGLEFSKNNEKLLWTTSLHTEMKCWDLRHSYTVPVQQLSSPNNCAYTCCGVNCTGDLVSGATEPYGEDVCLYIWDIRNTKPIFTSVFTDSHKEDITQVKFHPTRPKELASCSTDGLVCLFDISHTQEEDALQFVLNSESSVGQIGYYGDKYDKLFCITHIETLQLWDTVNASLLADYTDIRKASNLIRLLIVFKGSQCVDYLVDCFYYPSVNKLYLITGQHSGDLQMLDVMEDSVNRVCMLKGGHTATVRCLDWHLQGEQVVTGGEDSAVCCWKAARSASLHDAATTEHYTTSEHGKTASVLTNKARPHRTKPYARPTGPNPRQPDVPGKEETLPQ